MFGSLGASLPAPEDLQALPPARRLSAERSGLPRRGESNRPPVAGRGGAVRTAAGLPADPVLPPVAQQHRELQEVRK